MYDPTESARRIMVGMINSESNPDNTEAQERQRLETIYGKVWDTDQVRAEFKVLGFSAPFVIVERLDTGERGSLLFQHSPRFYFAYERKS